MKLVNKFYNLEIEFIENQVTVITVENPEAYSKIVGAIWNQVNGNEGDFVLSEREKIKNISKEVDCIINPFSLDCNNKKIVTHLYQELKIQADNTMQEELSLLNVNIMKFLDKLLLSVPYQTTYEFNIEMINLLKAYNVGIEMYADKLIDIIVEYLKVMSQLCNINVFVFIDLKHYLSEEHLEQLYQEIFYLKIYLVIIEPAQTVRLENEKCWIIDNDLCIIDL
ncbi:MAG: type II-A CRISPR-associated protein Csn2 [Lachnospiraceae bacterium]|nr:type II-A CRISPR-associated protein Csn2 [Lachnospiraceae bacterium]